MAKQELKRNLSLTLVTLYGLGNILGAGIYVLVGKVAGYAGENAILAFLIAMIIAGLTAFSYMELSSRLPQSASVSVYLHKAFGIRVLSVLIGLAMVVGGIASAAALSHGFAGYLNDIFSVPGLIASVGLLIALGLVAVKGIGESAKLAAIFTIVEAIGLLAVIWFGRSYIESSQITSAFSVDPAIGVSGILFGAFLAFYAFIGFEDMVNVVEEVKKPRVTMPMAILLSISIATVLYILVVLVSIAAVSPKELAASDSPLSLVFDKVSHIDPLYISVIGIAATVNGVLVQIIMGSRTLYGLSKQGWIPRRFSAVHPRFGTPVFATAVITGVMIVGVLMLGLVSLAQATSYVVLTVFTLVNVSLVVIKRRYREDDVAIKVPIIIPILGSISCFAMLVYQIFGNS
jgi:amino acid transporter